MATWKVSSEQIRLFPHPNSDRLRLAKVGMFQLVVNTTCGLSDGDRVVFAPKRSVIPPALRADYVNSQAGNSYLVGDHRDRVSSIRLRGELSEGVLIRPAYVLDRLGCAQLSDVPLGVDLSAQLGIQHYEYPIPPDLVGQVQQLRTACPTPEHDVELLGIYPEEFRPAEGVYGTEKVHGRQVSVLLEPDGTRHITSKGLADKDLEFRPDCAPDILYVVAVQNTNLFPILHQAWPGRSVQAFGEVIPSQSGFPYGQHAPTLRLFRIVVDGTELCLPEARSGAPGLQRLWVPIVYVGSYDEATLRSHAAGRERVSGRELHIREGIVITPMLPRRSREGWYLALKILNPAFKGGDDDPC